MTSVSQFPRACLVLAALCSAASADTLIINGALPGPGTHEIIIDQFDTQDGQRQLDAVHLSALTFFSGGFQTDGSGIPVTYSVTLTADYFLDETLLLETEAVVSGIAPNTAALALSFFDNDSDDTTLTKDLSAWIGTGTISLTGITDLVITEDPTGILNVGAGGNAQWTVEYTYSDTCPADLDSNGSVGFADLTQLLSFWGLCAACPADLDGNDSVGFADLTALLAAWGSCM